MQFECIIYTRYFQENNAASIAITRQHLFMIAISSYTYTDHLSHGYFLCELRLSTYHANFVSGE
jgi:hypothetical protein